MPEEGKKQEPQGKPQLPKPEPHKPAQPSKPEPKSHAQKPKHEKKPLKPKEATIPPWLSPEHIEEPKKEQPLEEKLVVPEEEHKRLEPEPEKQVPAEQSVEVLEEKEKFPFRPVIVGFVSVVVLVALGFAVYRFVPSLFKKTREEPIQKIELTPQMIREWGFISSFVAGEGRGKIGSVPVSVEVGIEAGEVKFVPTNTGILASIVIGRKALAETAFEQYVDVLKTLQNIYNTDVQALLDQAVDRREVLANYLQMLKNQRDLAQEKYRVLREEMDNLKVAFNRVSTKKENLEKDFFTTVEKLEASTSEAILKDFIETSQLQVDLKARFNALEKLNGFYESALKRVEVRIKAVELNEEALVKGIKVFEVHGGKLELIIKEQTK